MKRQREEDPKKSLITDTMLRETTCEYGRLCVSQLGLTLLCVWTQT